ncbi:unnamed protein product [Cylindrotheca closterium]|uniref:subtilisin n=1 Tax=Cylindrotheca closterium TaxID=2856 RepID=A0AAD2FGP2_9STRA|nr:unnamed protein product [Cylindrotheca closterium]
MSISLSSSLSLLIILQCLGTNPVDSTAASFFNDPDVVQDWIFQMINIYPVWEKGIFGKDIRIRVNDEGVDYRHVEFQNRFDTDASCRVFDAYFDERTRTYRNHGTVVASIIGAGGNNAQCAVGIAPEVILSSCTVVGAPVLDLTARDHSYPSYKLDGIHISHNSLGNIPCRSKQQADMTITFPNSNRCPFTHRPGSFFSFNGTLFRGMEHPCDVCDFPSVEPTAACTTAVFLHCQFYFEVDQEACNSLLDQFTNGGECSFQSVATLRSSVEKGGTLGRNEKGVIYVYASGNNFYDGDNSNFENLGRFPILVGAVGKDGQHSSYSTGGSSVLLTAPAGDFDDVDRQTVARAGGGCELAGDGTSYSSPIVSGVIALMLQVNPDLTWRDVQGILATTSEPVTHTVFQDETQMRNGAGLVHSNLYGFGIVNAMAAVTAAETWENYGPERLVTAQVNNLDLTITDDANTPISTRLEITNAPIFVENVEIKLRIQHLTRGHLQITLTSPDGTVSELTPGFIPENGQDAEWILRTVKSWGESPEGTWTLSIVDKVPGDLSNCADKAVRIMERGRHIFGCNSMEVVQIFHDEAFMETAQNFLDLGIEEGCCACNSGLFCDDTIDTSICFEAVRNGFCSDGALLPQLNLLGLQDEEGTSLREACCIFGGGTIYDDPSLFEDKLLGWELMIYGHPDPTRTAAPTMVPTSAPPTPAPSSGASTLKTWALSTLGLVFSFVVIC